jgi:hypothetical protein
MLRLLVTVVTVPAVLAGLVLAPHTHVHTAGTAPGSDAHHRHPGGAAVRHAHMTPHASAPFYALDAREGDESAPAHDHDGPSVLPDPGAFAFQLKAGPRSPTPSALAWIVSLVPPTMAMVVASVLHPPGHGPPERLAARPRAPPPTPPAAA